MVTIIRLDAFCKHSGDAVSAMTAALRRVAMSASSADMLARCRRYRRRARELRATAENVILHDTRRSLLNLAGSYEHLAAQLENRITHPASNKRRE